MLYEVITEEVTMKINTSEQRSEGEPESIQENSPNKEPIVPADRSGAKKTGLIFFPAFDWAISPTHPEREERRITSYNVCYTKLLRSKPCSSEAGSETRKNRPEEAKQRKKTTLESNKCRY